MLQLGECAMWSQVHRGVPLRCSLPPLFPGQKFQLGRRPNHAPTRSAYPRRVTRRGRYHVKALADSNTSALHRSLKALRHIISVDVMQRLHPYIGELDRASLR